MVPIRRRRGRDEGTSTEGGGIMLASNLAPEKEKKRKRDKTVNLLKTLILTSPLKFKNSIYFDFINYFYNFRPPLC
jgi:hypothetical protein